MLIKIKAKSLESECIHRLGTELTWFIDYNYVNKYDYQMFECVSLTDVCLTLCYTMFKYCCILCFKV